MRLNRRRWMQATSAALAYVAVPRFARAQIGAGTSRPGLTPAQIREDLAYLQTQWSPLDQSFNDQDRKSFDRAIAEAMANAATLSTEDFALDVMRAVAIPRNGHTVAVVGRLLGDLPIRAWWFPDGLYIISAQPQFPDLLGARVEKLGPLTPDEALVRVAPFISGTDQRIRYLSAAYLTSPPSCDALALRPKRRRFL